MYSTYFLYKWQADLVDLSSTFWHYKLYSCQKDKSIGELYLQNESDDDKKGYPTPTLWRCHTCLRQGEWLAGSSKIIWPLLREAK